MLLVTTLVVSFCKDGGVSVNVNLWFLVVCVRCEVLCRLVAAGTVFLSISIVVIFTERNDQCGNQQHSRELLMMGIVVPETC